MTNQPYASGFTRTLVSMRGFCHVCFDLLFLHWVIRDDTLIVGSGCGGFEGGTGIFPRLGLTDPGGCVFFPLRLAFLLMEFWYGA